MNANQRFFIERFQFLAANGESVRKAPFMESGVIVSAQSAFNYVELTPTHQKVLSESYPCIRPPFDMMAVCGRIRGWDNIYIVTNNDTIGVSLFASQHKGVWGRVGQVELECNDSWGLETVVAHKDIPDEVGAMHPGYGIQDYLCPLLETLSFFHVKGTAIDERSSAPTGLVARKRRVAQPIYTYKVLRLDALDRFVRDAKSAHGDVRAHIVRGHFKDYRQNGLGKYHAKGIFWCPAHVRGNKKLGIVAKEYEV